LIIIDYNGVGFWSPSSVRQRYELYAQNLRVTSLKDLTPKTHEEAGKRWIYPIMEQVIEGIELDDPACVQIGIEFIEDSSSFPFAMILKSNTARALRRSHFTSDQEERIRKRVVEMICTGYLPREFRQYAKLAKKIGMKDWLPQIEREADLSNPWIKQYYIYFSQGVS
jgi:hypothetical protein